MSSESFEFQAEITQLMSLIINAVYTNNDIFMRELISNSSDAIDKIKYLGFNDESQLKSGSEFYIKIIPNKEEKTLTFVDTGIGMTKDDLKNNLGTIAKSGTSDFLKSLTDKQNINMIGKFGVGFYSAYLVANSVDVYSKNNDDVSYMWSSNASSSFTITPIDIMPYDLQRGTCIVLHMKDDALEYLDDNKIREIVKLYSQFTSYDILLRTLVENKKSENEEDKADIEDVEDVDVENIEKNVVNESTITEYKFTKLNEIPIWAKNHSEVSESEYKEFYKVITGESWSSYTTLSHFHIEGNMDFTAIVFVPEKAPFDMFQKRETRNNIKLYVRKVYITDDCNELCPEWLSFVRGVVDSVDLPLTISRENFQHVKIMKQISKSLVKKCIEMLTNLADDTDKYNSFYKEFSKNIKLGVYEDSTNRQKLLNLLRFDTSHGKNQSLFDYCSRVKENNTNIYYISSDENTVLDSPFTEKCLKNGHEVIYMTDVLDEYIMQQVRDFSVDDKTFKFVNLTKEGFKSDGDNQTEENVEELCKYMKTVLGNNVEKVVKSERLENRPAIIVTSEFGHTARMEQIMNSQAMKGNNEMFSYMKSRKTLEINPNNKIIKELHKRVSSGKHDKMCSDLVTLLYESAMLVSGFSLDRPSAFVDKINNIIETGLNLDEDSDENSDNKPINNVNNEHLDCSTSQMEMVD